MYGRFPFNYVYGPTFNMPKKAKKTPKDNWFERLSNERLSSLCADPQSCR